MEQRIEALEREVLQLRRQLRLLQGILFKVQENIDEAPSDAYMPLWDGRDGQGGQLLTDALRNWRRMQRELQAAESQLASTKDKDSDEARYWAKQVEWQREIVRICERFINEDAKELIEANIMAEHDWRLVKVVSRTKALEYRNEACSNPGCGAVRRVAQSFRDDQVTQELVRYSNPSPMTGCPAIARDLDNLPATRRASGDEGIPF